MNRRVLLGMTLTLAFTTLSLPASSQAIAESVLLGTGSSTATVKAGSDLNSALNQSSKQLTGRVQQHVSQPPLSNVPQNGRNLLPKTSTGSTTSPTTAQPGPFVVSIQRAEPNCRAVNGQTSIARGQAAAQAPTTNCVTQNISPKPESQKYKSVITLASPK
jgi:hypothetical protein